MQTRAAVLGVIALLLSPVLGLSQEPAAPAPDGSRPPFGDQKTNKGLDAAKRMKERFGTMIEDDQTIPGIPKPPAHSPPAPAINITDPKADQQIYLAATGPYNYILVENGILTKADGTYWDASGAKLSSDHIAALIRGEPRAVALYSGFYGKTPRGIPRPRYKELRTDYDTRPKLREDEFSEVRLSSDRRDFIGKRTCAPPECEGRHTKGVPSLAATLNKIWEKIRQGNRPGQTGAESSGRVDEYGIPDLSLDDEARAELAAAEDAPTKEALGEALEKREKRWGSIKFGIWVLIGFIWAILLMRRKASEAE